MPKPNAAKRKREAIASDLEGQASVYSKFAASTQSPQLRAALVRLVAAQIEVAAILRAQNMDGGDHA